MGGGRFTPKAGSRPAIVLSPADYNRVTGMAVVCPITNQAKGFAWEVAIANNPEVSGVVLADQIKSVDWRARRAAFVCAPDEETLRAVTEKALALISPEDDDGDADR